MSLCKQASWSGNVWLYIFCKCSLFHGSTSHEKRGMEEDPTAAAKMWWTGSAIPEPLHTVLREFLPSPAKPLMTASFSSALNCG